MMSGAQTPIDMSQYADVGRRVEVPAPASAEAFVQTKIAVGARRGIADLPSVGGQGVAIDQAARVDPDFDLSTVFDVPAFLRRQEG